MIRAAVISIVLLATPASAQQTITMKDAAMGNVSLLSRICMSVMFRQAQNGAAFVNAGYTYRSVDRGVNQYGIHRGVGHYFDAPADTAHAQVDDPNRPAGICSVYTKVLNEGEFTSVVASAIQQFYPTAQRRGPNQWSISQSGGLPLILSISTIGNNHRYEAPGTVQLSMSYPG